MVLSEKNCAVCSLNVMKTWHHPLLWSYSEIPQACGQQGGMIGLFKYFINILFSLLATLEFHLIMILYVFGSKNV